MCELHCIIAEQAGHMRGLIRDLLDAGRIDSGTLSVAPGPSEVAALVERARSTCLSGGGRHAVLVDLPAQSACGDGRPAAHRAGAQQPLVERRAACAQSTPLRVGGGARGRARRRLGLGRGERGGPELLPHLFSKHGGGRGATAGHGLGLAICKELVEAQGGRIRAESPGAGRGATFTFTIPAAGAAGAAAARTQTPPPAPESGEPPRILVADDDPRTLRFVRDALAEAGYAPLVTGSPHDLPRIIRTERPRLVLLDLVLPDVDGIELLRQVPEFADLPVRRARSTTSPSPSRRPSWSPQGRAALRRRQEPEPFVLGQLAIDYGHELLRVLSLDPGRVVTFDTLLRRVWAKRENADTNLVRIFVRNHRGAGYRMAKPADR